MAMPSDTDDRRSQRPLVRVVLALVLVTSVLSLAYAAQYFGGGPLRLSTVSAIHSIDLSPQKDLLAAGADDGLVRVWTLPLRLTTQAGRDFQVAKEAPWAVEVLPGQGAPVLRVAFSPDGAYLVWVRSDGQVQRWSRATDGVETLLQIDGGVLLGADLNADRSVVATVGTDRMVRVWDLQGRRQIQAIGPVPAATGAVAIDAEGAQVAVGDGNDIQLWSVETGAATVRIEGAWKDAEAQDTWLGHTKEVTALAFSPDGEVLASGSADTTLVFWDAASGRLAWTSEGHWGTVTALRFNARGDLVLSGGKDNKSRTFRLPGGKSTAIYEGHIGTVESVSYGPTDGLLFTAGSDGTVRMWETANQYAVHLEWARLGLQPIWGRVLVFWLLASGILGLVGVWGLWRMRGIGHLLLLALYLLGTVVVLGLPLLEVMSYPLLTQAKLQIAWPLLALAVWYVVLLLLLTRGSVAQRYEAPEGAPLAQQLVISQRTVKTRLGIYALAVWLLLLVVVYSVLRRFNLDVAFMGHYLSFIMAGSWITFRVSALSIALAVVLALLGALGRLSRNPIANGVSGFYISLIRGTPLLVQIYIWYLGLPRLNVVLPAELAGILALGVNYGAYMTEIFRAGIQAIGKGQHEAAMALGMSRGQTFRRIVLPQAFRIIIPPIGNEFIAMMKDSSLVSVMSIWELTYRAQKIGRQNFRNMETFIIAAAFYWILTVVFQFLQGKLEEHMARSERR